MSSVNQQDNQYVQGWSYHSTKGQASKSLWHLVFYRSPLVYTTSVITQQLPHQKKCGVWSGSKIIQHFHHTQILTTPSLSFLLFILLSILKYYYTLWIHHLLSSPNNSVGDLIYSQSINIIFESRTLKSPDPNSLLSSRSTVTIPYWTSSSSWKHFQPVVPLYDCFWLLSILIGWYLILFVSAHTVVLTKYFSYYVWSQHIKLNLSQTKLLNYSYCSQFTIYLTFLSQLTVPPWILLPKQETSESFLFSPNLASISSDHV